MEKSVIISPTIRRQTIRFSASVPTMGSCVMVMPFAISINRKTTCALVARFDLSFELWTHLCTMESNNFVARSFRSRTIYSQFRAHFGLFIYRSSEQFAFVFVAPVAAIGLCNNVYAHSARLVSSSLFAHCQTSFSCVFPSLPFDSDEDKRGAPLASHVTHNGKNAPKTPTHGCIGAFPRDVSPVIKRH